MDHSAAVTAQTFDLYGHADIDDAVADSLAALSRDLKLAVLSYLGLRLVVSVPEHPIILTAFGSDVRSSDITTSLRLPLRMLAADVGLADPASTITFYAGTAGAFVDLAADLTYGLQPSGPSASADPRCIVQPAAGIALDDDLPPVSVLSGLTGATELAIINRALGMLIGRGHLPDDAWQELDHRAAASGLTPTAWATQLIRRGDNLPVSATPSGPYV